MANDSETIIQLEIIAHYILEKWLPSKTFFDDLDEPRCLLALQSLSKKLGVSWDEWMNILHDARPKWFQDELTLSHILKDINLDGF